MAVRLTALILTLCLLLGGCAALLNRSYSTEAPHEPFSDEEKDSDVLRAETYQGLVSALLEFVSRGASEGTIRLYNYNGSAESDLDAAYLELTHQDPLGAYAVDYITYELRRVMSYYEVELRKIVYRKTPEQMAAIVSVTGVSAIAGELGEVLADFRQEAVFRVSYFDEGTTAETIAGMVREAYYETPEAAFGLPEVEVEIYPKEAVGQQRIVEIRLTYSQDSESLHALQATLLERSGTLTHVDGAKTEAEQVAQVAKVLADTVTLRRGSEPLLATAYGALVEGEANEEGLALAAKRLCDEMGIASHLVRGSLYGAPRMWIVAEAEGGWSHWDPAAGLMGQSDAALHERGYAWSEDMPDCP